MKVKANQLDIEVEDSGADGSQSARPVLLLVMGLGMQLVAWPPAMVQGMVDAGLRVVRFDNRDIGLSQHLTHLGMPNVLWGSIKFKLGLPVRSAYSLDDMAQDAVGVMDALGIAKAHVLGISMGGMIAQRMAIAAPQRIQTLTSVMSSSGARGLPEAKPAVLKVLLSRPAGRSQEDIVNHYVKLFGIIGSPGFPEPPEQRRQRIVQSVARDHHPAGTMRQMMAVVADTGRRDKLLKRISIPTLVVHGRQDVLVPYACGEDTARRIPGARMLGIDGMGHDLAPGVVERLLPPVLSHLGLA